MIISQPGAMFEYDGVSYVIGGPVVCTAASMYEGLYGVITEVRIGADKTIFTEARDIPELYCNLDAPVHPDDIAQLEGTFSKQLSGLPVTLEQIDLEEVAMTPEMIKVIVESRHSITLYTVREDWAMEYHDGTSAHQFTDYHDAKRKFNEMLRADMDDGCISRWEGDKSLCIDIGEDSYECWIDGEYLSAHYSLSICTEQLLLSTESFDRIGREYIDRSYREDFFTSAEEQDIAAELGEERYNAFLSDPRIPGLIGKELDRGARYWEEYWDAVDNAVCELKKEYGVQASEAGGYGGQKADE